MADTDRPAQPLGPVTPEVCPLADDILKGADAIGTFMGLTRRQVYHLADQGRFPFFRLGAVLCARKSALLTHIAEQERGSLRQRSAS